MADPRSDLVPSRRVLLLAGAYAFTLWLVATLALVAIGDRVLPTADDPAAWLGYAIGAVGSGIAGYLAAVPYLRQVDREVPPIVGGLVLGAAIAVLGLTLDTAVMGLLDHGYPNVSDGRADTIALGLLVGHGAALLGAATAGWQRQVARRAAANGSQSR